MNHIANIHEHEGHVIFMECEHDVIERAWLKPGCAAYKKLAEVLTRPRLIAAIRKLSQYHQTSGLEARHALDNLLASKNTYHSYHSLSAWLFCANLHYNENSKRKQATKADSTAQWAIVYPKAFKGEKAVAKPLKEKPAYGYIDVIMSQVVQNRVKYSTLKKARVHAEKVLSVEPQSLVQKYLGGKEGPSKQLVVDGRKSRFSKPALPVSKEHGPNHTLCVCKGKCAQGRN
ncbi:uncharacterized protein LOC114541682 [Dendronephthya gigantea]|uniref:uncharacterized protein LOC114541682 n=1 Tax=Dendronephthya gigantea TaxID=151771 RepID=UPI00106C91AA|nr:uncharacterized protein LOC114541682 [Dendronephthya gigantea]XP_028417292.1 uncharacterized protein LOC114541682 [Dendronephthya gigantea]